jgi:hypothetical protein
MPIRTPASSIFRPAKPVDQSALREGRALVEDINRRGILRGAVSLGALTMLTGCDVSENSAVQTVLRGVSAWNDRVQAAIFRPDHLARTYSEAQVVKPPRFNAYYDIEDVKPVDGKTEQEIIIKHICVEGWDYIGQWSGVSLRHFLERIGADLTAKYVAFTCADEYTESIDMAAALHPQTILATKYAKQAIADPFGFPLRLRTATKLGFKNAKWIMAMEVTNTFPETFWSKQGFNWFAGL